MSLLEGADRTWSRAPGRRLLICAALAAVCLEALSSVSARAQNAEPVARGHGGPIRSVVSFTGDLAATGGFDTAIIVWGARSGIARRVLRLHDTAVTAMAAYTERCAVSGSDDGRLVRWCADGPEAPDRLAGHTGAISAIAVSSDRQWLATASWDGAARLWPLASTGRAGSPASGSVVAEHGKPVTGVALGDGDRVLITAAYDGEVRATGLAASASGQLGPRTVLRRITLPTAIHGMATLADGRVVLSSADGRLRVLGPDLSPSLEVELNDGPLTALAVSPDGRLIAVGGMLTPVTLIDARNGATVRRILGPGLPIWTLAFAGDGLELLTGGADGSFRRWRMPDGEPLGATAQELSGPEARAEDGDGARVFRACAACHTTRAGEGHRAGPTLHGVFGRRIGTAPGYAYSDALRQLDIVWSRETIARLFEIGPTAYTPGTKMPEQRITDPADRQAVVDWLERATRP